MPRYEITSTTPPIDILDIASAREAAASERLQAARAMQAGPAAKACYERAKVACELATVDVRRVEWLAAQVDAVDARPGVRVLR